MPARWKISSHRLYSLACQCLQVIISVLESSPFNNAYKATDVNQVELFTPHVYMHIYSAFAYLRKSEHQSNLVMHDCKTIIEINHDDKHLYCLFNVILSQTLASTNDRNKRFEKSYHKYTFVKAPLNISKSGPVGSCNHVNRSIMSKKPRKRPGKSSTRVLPLCRTHVVESADHRSDGNCPLFWLIRNHLCRLCLTWVSTALQFMRQLFKVMDVLTWFSINHCSTAMNKPDTNIVFRSCCSQEGRPMEK